MRRSPCYGDVGEFADAGSKGRVAAGDRRDGARRVFCARRRRRAGAAQPRSRARAAWRRAAAYRFAPRSRRRQDRDRRDGRRRRRLIRSQEQRAGRAQSRRERRPAGTAAYADDGEPWTSAATPENPLALSIAADGAPVAAKADVKAYALGVDRRAEIEAAHLPLLPFAPQTARALAGLGPKTLAELSDLGIVSPRDPDHPERPAIADWTLAVVYSWRQPLPAGKTTTVVVKYTPLKAQARFGHADALDLEDIKDEACLTPPQLAAAQDKLRGRAPP